MIHLSTAIQFLSLLPDPETFPEDVKIYKCKEVGTNGDTYKGKQQILTFEKKLTRGKLKWVLTTPVIME